MKTTAVRKILVPVDFSSCSRAALDFALAVGASLGASLEVMHVWQPEDAPVEGPSANAALEQELQRFAAVSPGFSPAIRVRIEGGDARQTIVTIAEKEGFDLVVLGTHGRTGRARSLAGSVAESVVRTSSCPVLTVRE